MKVSAAVMALVSTGKAQYYDNAHPKPVRPLAFHWNEDPHSVPDPLSGRGYMTSTMARYLRDDTTDLASEPEGLAERFIIPVNKRDKEPRLIQIESSSDSSSESSDSDSDSDEDATNVQWMVDADYGEADHNVVTREADIANGKKFSGWTNPLGWTDDGKDDDLVLVQLGKGGFIQRRFRENQFLQYAEAEGPTKVDYGENDNVVVNREEDIANGKKKSGWTNPLGWTDDGKGDETVVVQIGEDGIIEHRFTDDQLIQYAEAEGPTKVDFGENDNVVVPREADIANGKKFSGWTNPLGWTDDGTGDERVLTSYEESGFDVPADTGVDDDLVVNYLQTQDDENEDDQPSSENQVQAEEIIS